MSLSCSYGKMFIPVLTFVDKSFLSGSICLERWNYVADFWSISRHCRNCSKLYFSKHVGYSLVTRDINMGSNGQDFSKDPGSSSTYDQ